MSRRTPTCRNCGRQHFNFETCAEAHDRLRRETNPTTFWRTSPEGTTGTWGDRTDTVVSHAGGRLIGTRRTGFGVRPNASHPQYEDPEAA